MPEFRAVSPADEPAATLLGEYFSSRELDFPAAQGSYRILAPDPSAFRGDRGVFLLIGEAGRPDAGCGGVRRIDPGPLGARFEIKHLWVRPGSRGTGLGRALLAELARRARALGARELVLDTNDALEAAGALYRRTGFIPVAPYNDNPNATTWYAKPLDDEAGRGQ